MEIKFLVDFMCGRLAKWLRICGFDAEYWRLADRDGLLLKSLQEKRLILTRDKRLSKEKAWALFVIESDKLEEQLKQVAAGFNLKINEESLFTRCTVCNAEIQPIEKESVRSMVPPFIYQTHSEFSICPVCKRIYWEGTHWEQMSKKVEQIFSNAK